MLAMSASREHCHEVGKGAAALKKRIRRIKMRAAESRRGAAGERYARRKADERTVAREELTTMATLSSHT